MTNQFAGLFALQEKQHAELVAKHGEDYHRAVMTFGLNVAEQAVVDAWLESLLPEIKAKGGHIDDGDQPYYGAIGGGVTYSFTSTGLGDIITVKEAITGRELNVTEALNFFFFG